MTRVISLMLVALWLPFAALAAPVNCEGLAAQAAERYGLPGGLLSAIARTESGRAQGESGTRAWAWTANVRGKSYYYQSKDEALRHLRQLVARGEREFDVGCMQLNYRWHGEKFDDLEHMIDPAQNTDYAARYLSELRSETGSWDGATRYYHSRDPSRGAAYLGRVRKVLARLGPVEPTLESVQSVQYVRGERTQSELALPPRVAPRLAAPVSREDRRFSGGGPLVTVAGEVRYWDASALPEGAFPRMPDRVIPKMRRQ
ncbi:transglycosylase SLT domain-containing protein [Roseovarius sp.]|uniref:transglycosylase SLT domain-containing protein n=1 Tax=Roseovarius sp. TaxID=1486281 RepID=UPI003A975772